MTMPVEMQEAVAIVGGAGGIESNWRGCWRWVVGEAGGWLLGERGWGACLGVVRAGVLRHSCIRAYGS